jgi:hypothetical protein
MAEIKQTATHLFKSILEASILEASKKGIGKIINFGSYKVVWREIKQHIRLVLNGLKVKPKIKVLKNYIDQQPYAIQIIPA